ALRFDRGFGRDLAGGKTAAFQLIADGTDSNTAQIALGYAGRIVERYSSEILAERARVAFGGEVLFPNVAVHSRTWFNENLESKFYYLPGVIALMVTVTTLMLSALSIVREKEIGTIEQLIVSPIRPYELIVGKLVPFGILAVVNMVIITLVAEIFFRVPFRGSILLLTGATVVYLLTSLGIGLFISTISETQQEAVMATFLFFMPANLLSGFMFPIQNMPPVIQYMTFLNPLRYYLVILRGVFLKGVGIEILWKEIAILFIIGVVVFTVSSLRFHKRLG
ncbi:MAG TPA: ABC transporter permease, partial [bacterium]|nr:ABC transporter permease [bacterium]